MKKIKDILKINPFSDMPIDPSQMSLLVDREEELSKINHIIESAASGFRQNISILGKDGMGKTSLINYIYGRSEMKKAILPIKIEITQDSTVYNVLSSIILEILDNVRFGLGSIVSNFFNKNPSLGEVQATLKGFEVSKHKELSISVFKFINFSKGAEKNVKGIKEASSLIKYLYELTRFLPEKVKSICILIDEGEYVAKDISIDLLQNMKLIFQTNPFMLGIAGSPILFDKLAQIEPSFGNLFPEQNRIILKSLGIEDIKQLIAKRLDLIKNEKIGNIYPFTEDSIKVISEYSGGNPRYIIRIASLSILKALEFEQITSEHVSSASREIMAIMGRERFQRLDEDEQKMLMQISKLKSPSMTDLAKEINVHESTVIRRLDKLRDLGYVSFTKDGRKKLVTLEEPVRTFIYSII